MSGNPRGRGGGGSVRGRGDHQGGGGRGGRGGRGDSQGGGSMRGRGDGQGGGGRGGRGGRGDRGDRGDSPGRGSMRGRGDFQGGGGRRGRGDFQGGGGRGGRGDFQGGGSMRGRGDFQGGGGRGGRGGSMAMRGGPPQAPGGIFLPQQAPAQPDPDITAAEDALVQKTRDQIIDGFPGRRGYGTKGEKIVLRANYFTLTTSFEAKQPEMPLFRYEIAVANDTNLSKQKRRKLIDQLLTHSMFANVGRATDYGKTMVTTEALDLDLIPIDGEGKKYLTVIIPAETSGSGNDNGNGHGNGNGNGNGNSNGSQSPVPSYVSQARARNTWKVNLVYQSSFQLRELVEYLRSTSAGAAYAGRTDLVQMLNIILTKAPNEADQVSNVGQNNFYPFGTHPGRESYDLGSGLEALRGYFASVRPAIGRLLVNLNVTAGAFFKPIHLIDLLREFSAPPDQQEAFFRMLKVRATYVKDNAQTPFMTKTKTIVGLAKELKPPTFRVKLYGNAKEVKFDYVDSSGKKRSITVADYFRQHHGITLRRPELPVLNVGTRSDPQYLPQELCEVLPGQAYRRLLTGDQTSEMLRFAARSPNLNAMSIAGTPEVPGNGLRLFRLAAGQGNPQAHSIQPFGFRVGTEMITVPGRILDTPQIKYGGGKPIVPRMGSWNSANTKFIKPGHFRRWQVFIVNHRGNRGNALRGDPNLLVSSFDQFLREYGIAMGQRAATQFITLDPLTRDNRLSNDRKMRDAFAGAQDIKADIVLVILPEADRWLYARIKFYGDVEYGVGTVCSVGQKIEKEKGQGMYFGNLALKFNLKGGGISHMVQNTVMKPIDNNTMLMGIDVTHPAPGSPDGAPSVACLVASIDANMFQWPGSIRKQEGRKEQVDALVDMVNERLDLWQKKNENRLPSKIVLYRDGVSEGQYSMVLEKELPSLEKAFAERYGAKDKWPKVAIIIVGKRHHTRFYPTRKEDADYDANRDKGSWNPLPGTVVDRAITNKVLREFYLQAHQGLQGTARPAHYVVIKDDISFEADQLEQFTHHLCYLFNRATKAVSICPPAYYADLLCERGRAYLFSTLGENHASDTSVLNDDSEWSGEIHRNIRDTTWYV